MRPRKIAIVNRIGAMLRDHHEAIVQQPLPQRWVDLIKQLNEKEREQAIAQKGKR